MRRCVVGRVLAAALLFASTWALPAQAQGTNGTVAGTITAADTKQPIQGARVQVVGTTVGALTNARGEYRLTGVAAGQATFSYQAIGYKAVRVRLTIVGGQVTTHDEALTEQKLTLSEVVVTGTAGNQERRAQAASVASVNAAATTENASISNLGELLTARTPGVAISSASGSAGTAKQIRIRGNASISLSNTPLIFVDGVRIGEGQVNLGVNGQVTDRLNDINPDDIESIEIVKGPAAASLYGADASAGVIQIITKKGKVGQQAFTQNARYEYGSIDPSFTPGDNWGQCSAALVLPTSVNPLCRGKNVGAYIKDNPLQRTNAFGKGLDRIASWSGRGGGQNYSYYVSGNYDNNNGTLPNNKFTRYNGRVNFNFVPSDKWTIDANVGFIRSNTVLPDNDNNIYGFLGGGMLGTPTSRDDSGNPSSDGWFGFARQVAAITAIQNTQITNRGIYSLAAQYQPFSWWTNKLTLGSDIINDQLTRYFPKNSIGAYAGALNPGSNTQSRLGFERYTFDYLGNLRATFGSQQQWETNLSYGMQTISTRNQSLGATGVGFVVNSNNTVGSAASTSGTQGYSEQTQLGLLTQLQVGFRNKLFLQGAFRADKFSSFGSPQFFYLPKAGVSYVLSEEPWFKVPGVSNVRLRAAWGQTGRSPTAGAALTTFAAAPYAISSTGSNPGAVPLNPGNANLKAERGQETEFGVDFGMFRDRLTFEVTYFDKKTKDLLLVQPLPPSLGYSANPFANIGGVTNSGLEVAMSAQMVRAKDFQWDLRWSANTLHNEVTDLGAVNPFFTGNTGRVQKGQQIGVLVAKRIISVDTVSGVVTVDSAFTKVNNPLPTFESALWNSFKIGKFVTITASFDGKAGFGVYNLTDYFRETQLVRSANRLVYGTLSNTERLRRYGNPNPGQPAFVVLGGGTETVANANESYIQSGNFIRFRELAVALAVPSSFAKRIGATGGSVTLAANNLKLWTKYQGPDPEVLTNIASAFDRTDFLTVPTPKRVTLRVNLQY